MRGNDGQGTELHQGDRADDWGRFLKSQYKKELGEISRLFPHKRSLFIDYRQIERFGKAGITLPMNWWRTPERCLKMSGTRSKTTT